jgi:hypothetical protein
LTLPHHFGRSPDVCYPLDSGEAAGIPELQLGPEAGSFSDFRVATLALVSNGGADGRLAALGAVRRWKDRVTSPAMVLVWVLGLSLARPGW